MNVLLSLIMTIPFIGHYAVADDDNVYELLSDAREDISFPEYSDQQKRIILNQARLVLDEIFPHGEIKKASFGEKTNWTPKLNSIEKSLDSLSTSDFHWNMSRVFIELQDLHTSYYYPKPHACYASFLPLSVKPVIMPSGTMGTVVTRIIDNERVLEALGDIDRLNLEVGAEVLSVDGVPVKVALKRIKKITPGANQDAISTRAHGYLTFRSHRSNPVFQKDSVELTLRLTSGKVIRTEVPWISRKKLSCLSSNKSLEGSIEGVDENINEVLEIFEDNRDKSKSDLLTRDANGWSTTRERYLKYKILTVDNRKIGILKLKTFKPKDLEWKPMLTHMRDLMRNELSRTERLIIDLRDNGGGYIALAEGMLQLLTEKKTIPSIFRLRNSAVNLKYFQSLSWDTNFYNLLLSSQGNGKSLTNAIPFDWKYNYMSRGYFKPFGILTNANCYSSCDMFSAIVQDHSVGVVFGEDFTTGAGGANNVHYNSFRARFRNPSEAGLRKLPGDQNFGFSFRQYVRQGVNSGKLLEDLGVISDEIVPRTLSDVRNDSVDQYRKISRHLLAL